MNYSQIEGLLAEVGSFVVLKSDCTSNANWSWDKEAGFATISFVDGKTNDSCIATSNDPSSSDIVR